MQVGKRTVISYTVLTMSQLEDPLGQTTTSQAKKILSLL